MSLQYIPEALPSRVEDGKTAALSGMPLPTGVLPVYPIEPVRKSHFVPPIVYLDISPRPIKQNEVQPLIKLS